MTTTAFDPAADPAADPALGCALQSGLARGLDRSIWWHVYPLGFAGCPIRDRRPDDAGVGLGRLTEWLGYAVGLGVDGLLLGPVFESATHGYDTLDHFRVDRRLGSEADLVALLDGAGSRGLRVVLDGVFNHVGRRHPLFEQAMREGPDSYAAQHFRIEWSSGTPHPEVFEGHAGLVALDLTRAPAQDLVVEVMCHWLDRGVAGWRLDAAYAVAPWAWRTILDRVRARHPRAVFLGEVLHGDYGAFARASGMDSVTQYELWKGIWGSIADRNLFELDWALRRHGEFAREVVPLTFVGNHDVTRIASRVGADGALVALAVLVTVAGSPCVYAGDERAWLGHKEERLGGDDAVRPAFPAGPEELDRTDPAGWAVYRAHQRLLGLRRRHPWLGRAHTQRLHVDNRLLTYRSVDPTDPARRWLEVTIDLRERPRARIVGANGVEFDS